MNLSPRLFFEAAALTELYQKEVAAAKSAQSEGGVEVTPSEMLAIAIAIGGPLLKRLVVPQLPDETIERAAAAISAGSDRVMTIRAKAAAILDKAEAGATSALEVLK